MCICNIRIHCIKWNKSEIKKLVTQNLESQDLNSLLNVNNNLMMAVKYEEYSSNKRSNWIVNDDHWRNDNLFGIYLKRIVVQWRKCNKTKPFHMKLRNNPPPQCPYSYNPIGREYMNWECSTSIISSEVQIRNTLQ